MPPASHLNDLAKTLQLVEKRRFPVPNARKAPAGALRKTGRQTLKGAYLAIRQTLDGAYLAIEVLTFSSPLPCPFVEARAGYLAQDPARNELVAGNFVAQLGGNLCICNETCAINTWGFQANNG
jgi:hypothetical protein